MKFVAGHTLISHFRYKNERHEHVWFARLHAYFSNIHNSSMFFVSVALEASVYLILEA